MSTSDAGADRSVEGSRMIQSPLSTAENSQTRTEENPNNQSRGNDVSSAHSQRIFDNDLSAAYYTFLSRDCIC